MHGFCGSKIVRLFATLHPIFVKYTTLLSSFFAYFIILDQFYTCMYINCTNYRFESIAF